MVAVPPGTKRAAEAPLAPMSFVATIGDQVVGHVLLSPSRLDAPRRILDVLVLSPLGVLPGFQNRGIGTRLIEHALATAEGQGCRCYSSKARRTTTANAASSAPTRSASGHRHGASLPLHSR